MNKKVKTSVGVALTIFIIAMFMIFSVGIFSSRNSSGSSLVLLNGSKSNTKVSTSKKTQTNSNQNVRVSPRRFSPPVLITGAS